MGENEGGERGFGVCFGNNGGLQWDLGGDWGNGGREVGFGIGFGGNLGRRAQIWVRMGGSRTEEVFGSRLGKLRHGSGETEQRGGIGGEIGGNGGSGIGCGVTWGKWGHRGGIGGEIWGQRGERGVGKLNLGQNGGKPRQRGGNLGVD